MAPYEIQTIQQKEKKIIAVRQKDLESALKNMRDITAIRIIGNEDVYVLDFMKCNICGGNNLGPDPSGYMDGGCRDDLGRDFGCSDCTREFERRQYESKKENKK